MLAVARERRSDADAEHQYRALAAGGRTIDAQTSNDIVSLADAFDAVNPGGYSARVSTATSTVLARCKALGYPLSNAQVLELRQLLISHFSAPTTTTTVKP